MYTTTALSGIADQSNINHNINNIIVNYNAQQYSINHDVRRNNNTKIESLRD